jgi:quercetin dioxygenase-like cupin family protein
MKIKDVPFHTTMWSTIPPTEHPGEHGTALWRTVTVGNIRVRMVEYSPGYVANHWCSQGHVLLVLQGELTTELKDGRKFVLQQGSSYQVSDDEANPHRSRTEKGAQLFIVD